MQQRYTDPSGFARGKSSRVLLTLAGLVLIGGGVAPSCLITSTPQFPTAQGIVAGAACMCATCLDKLFCMDAAGNFSLDCPNPNFPILAVQASQVDSLMGRSSFFCVPDSDTNVNFAQDSTVACPVPPGVTGGEGGGSGMGGGSGTSSGLSNPLLAPFEHIGCNDVPVTCLTPSEQSACNLAPGPNDPPCPFSPGSAGPAARTACGSNASPSTGLLDPSDSAGEINAAAKVLAECNLYNIGIPTDQPRRYCFTSCIDETWTYESCQSIDNGGQCTSYCDPTKSPG